MKKSGIIKLKSKFFLYRVLIYFSFLCFPFWIPKLAPLSEGGILLSLTVYLFFMLGQWFLVGKEIDYRLKIYYRAKSSVDRIIYRSTLGMTVMIFIYNIFSLFPEKWEVNLFWIFWGVAGLFYSWPTRGKIILESVSSNFGEFKHLDGYERIVLALSFLLFLCSLPSLPVFSDLDALKFYLDPQAHTSQILWNFLRINYAPFLKHPELIRIAWSFHYYAFPTLMSSLAFYAFSRFFLSRRLALLSSFSLLANWAFSKFFYIEYSYAMETYYALLIVWATLWTYRSGTYRAGLFLGFVIIQGTLFNSRYALLGVTASFVIYYLFMGEEKSSWFKKKFLKYILGSLAFSCLIFFTDFSEGLSSAKSLLENKDWINQFSLVFKKAFLIMAPIGLTILLLPAKSRKKFIVLDEELLLFFKILFFMLVVFALLIDSSTLSGIAILWPLTFLALVPIEILFQNMSRVRLKRNIVYLLYIFIILLDSHFEGRAKIFLSLFVNN